MLPLAEPSISNIYHQLQIVEQHSHFHTTHNSKDVLGVSQLGKLFFQKYTHQKVQFSDNKFNISLACCLFGFQLHLTHSKLSK
jgi:hypothetical protein